MKLKTKLGLGLVLLNAGIAHAGGNIMAMDANAFSELHPAGLAVLIQPSNVALAYYADKHDYVMGVSVSPYTDQDVAGVKTHNMTGSIFVRKNMPLTTNVVLGYGLEGASTYGKVNDVKKTDAYSVVAYTTIEYAATKNVYVSASISAVNYDTFKLGNATTKTTRYFKGGAAQLAYRFN